MRVKAFTLAEVLITLGIVGVVSMMVMPSLMQKYQKRKTISQFKKVYSTMSQGFLKASQDYDLYSLGNNWQNRDEVMETMSKYFQTARKYTTADVKNGGRDSLCFDKNNRIGFPKQHPEIGYRFLHQDKMDYGMTSPLTGHPSLELTNGGVCIGFSNYGAKRLVMVDINGNSTGPNRLGYDLFYFHINENNQLVPFYGGWWSNRYTTRKSLNDNCDKTINQSGWSCSGKIIIDGYKINYW